MEYSSDILAIVSTVLIFLMVLCGLRKLRRVTQDTDKKNISSDDFQEQISVASSAFGSYGKDDDEDTTSDVSSSTDFDDEDSSASTISTIHPPNADTTQAKTRKYSKTSTSVKASFMSVDASQETHRFYSPSEGISEWIVSERSTSTRQIVPLLTSTQLRKGEVSSAATPHIPFLRKVEQPDIKRLNNLMILPRHHSSSIRSSLDSETDSTLMCQSSIPLEQMASCHTVNNQDGSKCKTRKLRPRRRSHVPVLLKKQTKLSSAINGSPVSETSRHRRRPIRRDNERPKKLRTRTTRILRRTIEHTPAWPPPGQFGQSGKPMLRVSHEEYVYGKTRFISMRDMRKEMKLFHSREEHGLVSEQNTDSTLASSTKSIEGKFITALEDLEHAAPPSGKSQESVRSLQVYNSSMPGMVELFASNECQEQALQPFSQSNNGSDAPFQTSPLDLRLQRKVEYPEGFKEFPTLSDEPSCTNLGIHETAENITSEIVSKDSVKPSGKRIETYTSRRKRKVARKGKQPFGSGSHHVIKSRMIYDSFIKDEVDSPDTFKNAPIEQEEKIKTKNIVRHAACVIPVTPLKKINLSSCEPLR